MEQRRLRLGDILDDYCPRERRVTNHAVVAMIEEDVKQTRCMTCDAEHAYKGGKEPRRRKKDPQAALYNEVLAGMPEALEIPPVLIPEPSVVPEVHAAEPVKADEPPAPVQQAEEPAEEAAEPRGEGDDGPFHRRLIRATLPRPEGQKEVRQIPEFTIRQNGGRGPSARPGRGTGQGTNGNRPYGGARRFGPSGGGNPGMPGGRGPGRGTGRPGFGNPQRPPTGPGRGPAGPRGRKRSR